MDVALPPVVSNALADLAGSAAAGYQQCDITQAVQHWYKQSGYELAPQFIVPAAGVVQSLFACVAALTVPGSKVMVCSPVYGPFFAAVRQQQRELADIPLISLEGKLTIDFDALDPSASMLLLCNPNNPTGDVWDETTLRQLSAFCRQHSIVLVCDEVHRDFIFDTPPVSAVCLFDEPDNQVVVLNSAAKSFNLAGLGPASYALVQQSLLRSKLHDYLSARHLAPALPASVGLNAAYLRGQSWLAQVLSHIDANRQLVRQKAPELPSLFQLYLGKGTYFAWLDASELGTQAQHIMLNHYHLALGNGAEFGQPGWFRLNLATHPDIVSEVMSRLCYP